MMVPARIILGHAVEYKVKSADVHDFAANLTIMPMCRPVRLIADDRLEPCKFIVNGPIRD